MSFWDVIRQFGQYKSIWGEPELTHLDVNFVDDLHS